MKSEAYVYICTNQMHGVLYTGVTSDLIKRIWQHKEGIVEGFTNKYNLHMLVWYEIHQSIKEAIVREKAIKSWKRQWKIELVEKTNPNGTIFIQICYK